MAQDINACTFTGNLVRDVEMREVNDTVVGNFSIAVNGAKLKNGEQRTTFLRCAVWGKYAQALEEYLVKGLPVTVQGELQSSQYTREGDDKPITSYDLRVESMKLGRSGNGNGGSSSTQEASSSSEEKEEAPF